MTSSGSWLSGSYLVEAQPAGRYRKLPIDSLRSAKFNSSGHELVGKSIAKLTSSLKNPIV
jgi:hypothetical protein